ncbi:MAG TPA: TerC family protein [Candidatus Deferrimicrobiaceae bacterium]|nr:TerC family protein [Candidatus Deferrimicrobiaceae bacterium]
MLQSVGTPLLWAGFTVFVIVLLAIDLLVFHKREHEIRPKEALAWSAGWVCLALLFNAGVYRFFGAQRGLEFFTGYLIELALSVDNLFVFILIFHTFHVRPLHQHRVLFWGILGAQVMRAVFILLGAALLQAFHWVTFLFGGFLIFTGVKILLNRGTEVHPEKNPVLRWFGKIVPTLPDTYGGRFTIKLDGRRYATSLLPVLVVIEVTDLMFAVDSIPAIFAVTKDPFIVYTSNIFAILGLRSLYFLLASAMGKFHHLKFGLGLVLSFVGVKMVLAEWVAIPIEISLAVVVALLGGSVVASLLFPPRPENS